MFINTYYLQHLLSSKLGYHLAVNVYEFFTRVQQLGGFEAVNEKKVWKQLYEEMSGNSQSGNPQHSANSYASMMKRHYERLGLVSMNRTLHYYTADCHVLFMLY